MPMVRVGAFAMCAAAAAALLACAGLSPAAPAGAGLAGAWKLDRAASDDPDKVLAKMRAQAFKLMSRRQTAPEPRPGTRGGGTGGAQTREVVVGEDYTPEARGAPRPDPLLRSPMARIISKAYARGDFLNVRQSPAEIVLDYGTTQRRFTPGEHSVVSAEGGVGDQTTGWKGREFVIELKAQMGPSVTERYSVSPDGGRLVERLRVGPAELPAVELTRVYRAMSEAAPRQPPTSD